MSLFTAAAAARARTRLFQYMYRNRRTKITKTKLARHPKTTRPVSSGDILLGVLADRLGFIGTRVLMPTINKKLHDQLHIIFIGIHLTGYSTIQNFPPADIFPRNFINPPPPQATALINNMLFSLKLCAVVGLNTWICSGSKLFKKAKTYFVYNCANETSFSFLKKLANRCG